MFQNKKSALYFLSCNFFLVPLQTSATSLWIKIADGLSEKYFRGACKASLQVTFICHKRKRTVENEVFVLSSFDYLFRQQLRKENLANKSRKKEKK